MKEIFTDFYKRVLGFFQNDKGENTKEAATNRLKLVLLHDRTNLDVVTMQKMREQLINVISKYIEIDKEALDLNLEGEGDSIALMLNIPVVRARTKEEIEELEIAEEEAKRAEILAALEASDSDNDVESGADPDSSDAKTADEDAEKADGQDDSSSASENTEEVNHDVAAQCHDAEGDSSTEVGSEVSSGDEASVNDENKKKKVKK